MLIAILRVMYLIFWSSVYGVVITVLGIFLTPFGVSAEYISHPFFKGWADKLAKATKASLKDQLTIDLPNLNVAPTIITSNHVSWVDVFILLTALQSKIPVMIFIMKKQLLYAPLFGTSAYFNGCPMLSRSGHRSDLRLIQKSASKYSKACFVIFPEGTRYKKTISSSYQYLLNPKPLGVSAVLKCQATPKWLDCHIYYQKEPSFLDFLLGRLGKVSIKAEWVDAIDRDSIKKQWAKKDRWIKEQTIDQSQ